MGGRSIANLKWHKFFNPDGMSLSLYKKKRSFDKTPEPSGKERSSKGSLRFVIQKHDASHLHYDFRLEMDGVLKSWAVPKGPSLNPSDKRLAMMVEDHPYDYRNFEGVIPEGNYGGGTVIVWDEGFYEPLDSAGLSRKEKEKALKKQLHAGNLKFIMHGKKIKGEFALFLMKARGERSWILMKKNDAHATDADILKKNKSVQSGKTLAQVARAHGAEVKHPDEKTIKKQQEVAPEKKAKPGKKEPASAVAARPKPNGRLSSKKKLHDIKELLGDAFQLAKKSPAPADVLPMMATLGNEAFDDDNWIYEIKWDGYRAVGACNGSKVELTSRNLSGFTETYKPVTEALSALQFKAVFDGEIVAVDQKGMAVFQSLQNWQNTPVHLRYYIFDLIWMNGYDLTGLPLLDRKKILKAILPEDDDVIKYSDHIERKGKEFFEAAIAQGLEGIMAKKSESTYRLNTRSPEWLKIKGNLRQEVIIAGYTQPRNSRKFFGSLLLGVYEENKLIYVGHTGSGFNAKSLEAIYNKLQPLTIEKCPFEKCPKGNMPVTWVKPKMVCEIKFSEWTKERIARHPIFMGLRSDKKPKDVIFEKAENMATLKERTDNHEKARKKKSVAVKKSAVKKQAAPKSNSIIKGSKKDTAKKTALRSNKKGKVNLVDPGEGKDQQIIINGRELKLTNLNKPYWKKEGFTKGNMINYYIEMAPFILPYMKDRPQSLNRHPNGIEGPNFFHKDQKGKVPDWMQTHEDFSESTNETIEYLVCSNEATLIYMANLGCIEMNPWHSRSQSWEQPDWCLIDLDPDDPNSFEQVMDVAKTVKQVLDSIGADAYCKTSGSTGIHIYIPLGAKYSFEQSRQLAELVVTMVNHEMPGITSIERKPAKRKGKIYLDYLQNRQTQTAACAYSLRPKPGVPVSTPLDWSELKKGLTSKTWNAHNIFDRLKAEGDVFKPVLGKGINLEKVLGKLASLLK